MKNLNPTFVKRYFLRFLICLLTLTIGQSLTAKTTDSPVCPLAWSSILVSPTGMLFGEAFAANDGTFGSSSGWTNTDHVRALADVNGDGRADFVGFGNDNVLVQLGKPEGRFGAAVIAHGGFFLHGVGWNNASHVRALGDVNGDGRADIVAIGNEKVFVALGQTNGTFGGEMEAHGSFFCPPTGWQVAAHFRGVADVNGDKRADLVGAGNEKVFVALGQPNGTFSAEFAANDGFFCSSSGWTNTSHVRTLADVNGDGRADFVGFGNDNVFVQLGQANGHFGGAITAAGTQWLAGNGWNNTKHVRTLADVNGDGRADIIGFGNEQVIVSYGQSDGTFGSAVSAHGPFFCPPAGWQVAAHFRGAADVNGDKKADLVGAGNAQAFMALAL